MTNDDLPTEYYGGGWHVPTADGPDPLAVVRYDDVTGLWVWWGLGLMSEEPTYDEARESAERWVVTRLNGARLFEKEEFTR
jgi:hypothetical protein